RQSAQQLAPAGVNHSFIPRGLCPWRVREWSRVAVGARNVGYGLFRHRVGNRPGEEQDTDEYPSNHELHSGRNDLPRGMAYPITPWITWPGPPTRTGRPCASCNSVSGGMPSRLYNVATTSCGVTGLSAGSAPVRPELP